jgi:hypothetical protein
MKIAFDLDDTLIPGSRGMPCEPTVPWSWLRPWFNEPLRRGTRHLLAERTRSGWDVWIYTTSYRDPLYLRIWFLLLGVRLGGVVNQAIHDRVLAGKLAEFKRNGRYPPSKYPPAFGIDLLVDDLEGVRLEGKQYGFAVVRVAPDDPDWTARVLAAVGEMKQR